MKIKNILFLSVRLFTFFLLIASCEKMFELPNDSLLPEDKAFVDEFSARSSVMGVYALLQDVAQQLIILGEVQGDLLTVTENADNDLRQLNEHRADERNIYTDPSSFFKVIVNCNEILHKIHIARENDKNISELELATYIAELKLIRAWVYFKMVQLYGEVPYFEEPLSDYNQSLSLTSKLETLQTEDFVLDTILAQIIEVDTFELNMLEDSPFFALRFSKFTNWARRGIFTFGGMIIRRPGSCMTGLPILWPMKDLPELLDYPT